jgi:putative transposase
MKYDGEIHHRRSIRLRGYDYSQPGAYFVTICTYKRACLFGSITDGEMQPNTAGRIVQAVWAELPVRFPHIEVDNFITMPNHIHGIIHVGAQFIAPSAAMSQTSNIQPDAIHRAPTLGEIIRAYKAVSTREIRQMVNGNFNWQRSFYDYIIRDEDSLNRVRQYILDNPARWEFDEENPAAATVEPDARQ